MTTSPVIIPCTAPMTDGLPNTSTSKHVHTNKLVAAQMLVFMTAREAIRLADSAAPPLNPAHPIHSSPAPANISNTLLGGNLSRSFVSLGPTCIQQAQKHDKLWQYIPHFQLISSKCSWALVGDYVIMTWEMTPINNLSEPGNPSRDFQANVVTVCCLQKVITGRVFKTHPVRHILISDISKTSQFVSNWLIWHTFDTKCDLFNESSVTHVKWTVWKRPGFPSSGWEHQKRCQMQLNIKLIGTSTTRKVVLVETSQLRSHMRRVAK